MEKNENKIQPHAVDQKFISTVLEGAELKLDILSTSTISYLMRAAMAGVIVLFGYMIYLAIEANFTVETLGGETTDPIAKVLAGAFFSLCLVAIYYTKSELLTSNMMMTTVAKYFGKITVSKMMKVLVLCFVGNLIGGLVVGFLIGVSSLVSDTMAVQLMSVYDAKMAYLSGGATGLLDLLIRALFCNFFINLAMLMVYSGNIKSDTTKVIAMFFGVFIFMYLGLEHSVANTVFFSLVFFYNLFHPAVTSGFDPSVLDMIAQVFIVLIGNFIGGGVLIGLYYALINKKANL